MENLNQIPNIQPVESVQFTQRPEPVKNQNIFKILFIISLFVILGIVIAFYFVLNNKINKLSEEKDTEITNQTIVKPTSEPTAIPTVEKISNNPTPTGVDQVKELTMLINPTNKPNVTVSVSKIIGNYATGGAGSLNSSGYGWTAVKINGVWKIVHTGQDGMTCDIVDQYKIPKEIYGNCYKN